VLRFWKREKPTKSIMAKYAEALSVSEEVAADHLTRLLQLPKFRGIKIDDDLVSIKTAKLTGLSPYMKTSPVPIGEFTISFDKNLTRFSVKNRHPIIVDGEIYHHSFFYGKSGTSFCLGTATGQIFDTHCNQDYPLFIYLLIDFLELTAWQIEEFFEGMKGRMNDGQPTC